MQALVCVLTLCIVGYGLSLKTSSSQQAGGIVCSDPLCHADPLGFEAVIQIHGSIDDDQDGSLDRAESDGFFRDELKHEDGAARQATFHGADDLISVQDLWKLWTLSEVYNWTVDDVLFWLEDEVGLPKYTETFRVNAVDGHLLPRIAVSGNYVSSILDIKSPVHKQKLSLKATDLVLFGQKKKGHNWIKDIILIFLLIVTLVIAWLARRQNLSSKSYIRKVMEELEGLQKSEDMFKNLQNRYEQTKKEHLETAKEKQNLEEKLKDEVSEAKNEAERLRTTREATEEEISRLKLAELELVEVRKALADSERCCEQMRMEVPPLLELQQWLQLSYEIETQHYEAKKEAAEQHLRIAREMCERIRRKRSGILGSLRIAHSTSLDDTDQSIMQARGALEEVKLHLQERTQRWQEIENICGFDIIHNPGLHVLETTLRGVGSTYLAGNCTGMTKSASTSTFSNLSGLALDSELDEDLTAGHLAAVGLLGNQPTMGMHRSNGSAASIAHMYQPTGSLVRPCPDRRVWPNLMKAGMQLTMFGLGLTNPHLGGVNAPRGTLDSREKRRTLSDRPPSGQLTGSLGRHSRTVPRNLLRSDISNSSRLSDHNGRESSPNDEDSSPQDDQVKFGLGDERISPTTQTPRVPDSNHNNTYSKSHSTEPSTGTERPPPLTASQSDSALQIVPQRSPRPAQKRAVKTPEGDGSSDGPTRKHGKSPNCQPDPSLNGSTDSLETTSDGKKQKKKTSLRITKLFKKKED